MERGYIKFERNDGGQLVITAKLVNGNLWMTKHEIATLFHVYVNTVGNNLRAIFKSGILSEQDVTLMHRSLKNSIYIETVYYNLEALVFLSYRISSYETKIFREWALQALLKHTMPEQKVFIYVQLMNNRYSMSSPIILN